MKHFLRPWLVLAMPALFVFSQAQGWAAEPRLPEEAQKLKAAYQQAVDRAIQPLHERYIAELKRLIEQTTQSGKLQDAMAVKAELDVVSAGSGEVADFENRLYETKWKWNGDIEFTFKRDGTTPPRGFSWKTLEPYKIEFTFGQGKYHGTMVFVRGMQSGTIYETNPEGKTSTQTLVRVRE